MKTAFKNDTEAMGALETGKTATKTTHQGRGSSSPTSVTADLYPGATTTSTSSSLLRDIYQELVLHADSYCEWVEVQDDLSVLVDAKPHAVSLFRSVYRMGVQQANVLRALAQLVGITNEQRQQCVEESSLSLPIVAAYFSLPCTTDTTRLACLRLLVVLKSPLHAGWQVEEAFLKDTLSFVMQSNDWEFLHHSEMALLCKLRALIHDIKRMLQGQQLLEVADHDMADYVDASAHMPDSFAKTTLLQETELSSQSAASVSLSTPHTEPALGLIKQKSFGGNQSRQNLRELEQRFKSQVSISNGGAMISIGNSECTEGALNLQLDAADKTPFNDRLADQPSICVSPSPATSAMSFVTRMTTAVHRVIPVDLTTLLDKAAITVGAPPAIDDEATSLNIWGMQLSKVHD